MAGRITQIIIAGATYATAAISGFFIDKTGDECGGKQRWDVKVLNDAGADKIKKRAKIITIEELINMEEHDIGKNTPRLPEETKKYKLENVRIKEKITEKDSDLHLVLADDDGNEMIAEIPYFECDAADNSGYAELYRDARAAFLVHARDYKKFRWDVTGVAFFDLTHGTKQHGLAPNAIELHPVLFLEAIPQ